MTTLSPVYLPIIFLMNYLQDVAGHCDAAKLQILTFYMQNDDCVVITIITGLFFFIDHLID